jgi:glycosyltransferase involved in cell wall biosynthesis
MQRLAEDAALARRLGEAGRRVVQERFSWEAIAARWEDVYRKVVEERPA